MRNTAPGLLLTATLAAVCTPAFGHDSYGQHRPAMLEIVNGRLAPSPVMRLPSDRQADLDAAVADMAEALRAFSASLTDAQRQQLMFPLDALERTTSRDTRMTPAFCAVLTWCAQGWGLSLGTLSFEQRTAFEGFLRIALGPSGYGTVSAIRDRQNLIGVLENSANTKAIETAAKLAPGRTFHDLNALVKGLEDAGIALPPDAAAAAVIGGLNPGMEDWRWTAPGRKERWNQFEQYTIAIFGQPGDGAWATRIEGHHLSVNLTFVPSGTSWQVHATPLFIGSFPIVVPPPVAEGDLGDPMTWQQGQNLGLGLIRSIRKFWLTVPERQRVGARRAAESFPQRPPLANYTPRSPMLAALAIKPDPSLIERGAHLKVKAANVSAEGRRQIALFYDELLSTQHPAVAAGYRRRLNDTLRTGTIVATWAGGDLADAGSEHFTSIAVGPFLVELLQTPQYSVTSPRVPWSNHLHVMLRDVASAVWGDPLGEHLQDYHAVPPAEAGNELAPFQSITSSARRRMPPRHRRLVVNPRHQFLNAF